MRRLIVAVPCVAASLLVVSRHVMAQPAAAPAPAPTGIATAAIMSADAPDELEAARAEEDDNRDNLFQDDIGARTRHATELEIITDRDWNHDDQHGSIGLGFSWSLSLQRPENFRLLTLYAGILFGQLGDDRHKWVQLQGGYRPTVEIPVDFEIKPYLGPRAVFSASTYAGPGPTFDGAFAVGGAIGGRLLGGLLAVEATADAVYSLGTGFRVGNDDGDWVPRVGLGIKTDFCAFEAGDVCQYRAPKPQDIDLGGIMDKALVLLAKKLGAPQRCQATNEAVTLQTDSHHPECGGPSVEGFFCRLKAASSAGEGVAIELTREVHSALAACYTQGRVDERSAAERGVLLVRKLRYGAYAPEFRNVIGCDADAAKVPPPSKQDEQMRDDLADQSERAEDDVEAAKSACPLAALALGRLVHEIDPHRHD